MQNRKITTNRFIPLKQGQIEEMVCVSVPTGVIVNGGQELIQCAVVPKRTEEERTFGKPKTSEIKL